jgi:hypothetical protein
MVNTLVQEVGVELVYVGMKKPIVLSVVMAHLGLKVLVQLLHNFFLNAK